MNKFKVLLFALSVLGFMAAMQIPAAQAAKKEAARNEPGQPALELPAYKKMVESGSPSSEKNSVLMKLIGEWHYKVAFWAVPGAEPKWTAGITRNEMTLDDRFLSCKWVGELDVGGNDAMINGQGLIGYDNSKKSFTSVWADTLTTSLMTGAGKYDPKTNAIIETGQFTNPLTGAEARFRSELKFTDDDNYKRTIFAVGKSGKETKLMEFDFSKTPVNDGNKMPLDDSKKP